MKTTLLFATLLTLAACPRVQAPAISETIQTGSESVARAAPAPSLSPQDVDFVRTALAEGMGEVELATVVRAHSRNPEVRALASDVIDDFDRIDAELANVAYARSLSMPGGVAPNLEAAKRSILAAKQGMDAQYLDALVATYNDLLARYTAAAQNTSDADLKKIAGPAVAKLQEHVQRARKIREKLT